MAEKTNLTVEEIDLYDNLRNIIGHAEYHAPLPSKTNKLFVHVWFVNSAGQFLLQQRAPTTHRYANKWTQTGGCVRCGETSFACAMRETKEELGITSNSLHAVLLGTVKNPDNFVDVWLMHSDTSCTDMVLQPDEVQDAKWVDTDEIRNMNNLGLLTPTMIPELEMILHYIETVGGLDKIF